MVMAVWLPSNLSHTFNRMTYMLGVTRAFRVSFYQQQSTGTADGDFDASDQLIECLRLPASKLCSGASDAFSECDGVESKKTIQETSTAIQRSTKDVHMQQDKISPGHGCSREGYPPEGVCKVILLGEVGNAPVQKNLGNGRTVTVFTIGTGGMHNNHRPVGGETTVEYAKRSGMQWHRVAIYQGNIGNLAKQYLKQGSHVYVEGNMETRLYEVPQTGALKRVRETAIRRNGRLLLMDSLTNRPCTFDMLSDGIGVHVK